VEFGPVDYLRLRQTFAVSELIQCPELAQPPAMLLQAGPTINTFGSIFVEPIAVDHREKSEIRRFRAGLASAQSLDVS
jgi:hypothetical protein